jgi:hypothetical protein
MATPIAHPAMPTIVSKKPTDGTHQGTLLASEMMNAVIVPMTSTTSA